MNGAGLERKYQHSGAEKSNHNNAQERFKTLLSSIWAVEQFTWDALTLRLFDRNEGLPKHEFHGTMRKIANIQPNDSGPLLANGLSRDKDQNHAPCKYNQHFISNIYLPTSWFRTFLYHKYSHSRWHFFVSPYLSTSRIPGFHNFYRRDFSRLNGTQHRQPWNCGWDDVGPCDRNFGNHAMSVRWCKHLTQSVKAYRYA